MGDVTGRQFTSVCAPEETRRAREVFASKIAGTAKVTDAEVVLVQEDGERIGVEVSSVPLYSAARSSASSASSSTSTPSPTGRCPRT